MPPPNDVDPKSAPTLGSLSGFTPGTWRLSKTRPCDIYDEGGRYIGTTYGNYEKETPPHIFATDKANARLIAAATELLASLKVMVRYFDTFYGKMLPADVAEKAAAVRAIAKAEGRDVPAPS
jgi:hypothetical protein